MTNCLVKHASKHQMAALSIQLAQSLSALLLLLPLHLLCTYDCFCQLPAVICGCQAYHQFAFIRKLCSWCATGGMTWMLR